MSDSDTRRLKILGKIELNLGTAIYLERREDISFLADDVEQLMKEYCQNEMELLLKTFPDSAIKNYTGQQIHQVLKARMELYGK